MKIRIFYLLFTMFSFIAAWSQGKIVTGRITGQNGEALPGVTVTVKGTGNATSTSSEGRYSISVPGDNAVLVFSYVGNKTQEITVGDKTSVDVLLQEETSTLNDVVVVGYTTQRRRDVTGSISSVGANQLKTVPLSSAAEALTGRLAGVQVTTTEGAPGADVVIRVRGGGSITQDNAPIYIVDGIQVENALSVISPQDIASVDVLKDASTTAIYGARGANGVVIITTKSGRVGKTQVTYNGSIGFREIYKKMDVLNPYDFVTWQYERARIYNDTSFNRTYGTTWDTLQNYKNIEFVDWQEEVFGRKAGYQNHNVALSGGSQNTTFNLSLTSNSEEGILLESGFDRKLVNFKLDNRATDKFRFGLTARYQDQIIKGAGTTNSGTRTTNRLRHSIQYRPFEIPTAPDADEFDEDYYIRSANIVNPVILTSAEYRRSFTKGVNLSGYVSYNILKNLTFKSTGGFDNTNVRLDQFFSKVTGTARNFASLPVASIAQQNSVTFNNSNTLQYSLKNFKGNHDIDFLLGHEIYETRSKSNAVETRFFPADISADKALSNFSLGSPPSGSTQPRPTTSETPPNRILSFFGRANYAYGSKYLASFSLRADRSSKFKYENGVLIFPSGSAAWRFTQEPFMENVSWLSDGKLRVGFGTAGNNRIGDLLYLQLYGVTGEYALNHTLLPGFSPSALANENLKWEKTVSKNIGLDLSFLRNRIQFTVDAYKNDGEDLLLAVAIPPTSGYTSQLQNVGSTSNKGIEFQVNGNVIQQKDFSWTSNFNISFNKNKVEDLGGLTQQTRNSGWQGSDGADDYLVKVGEPVGLMYGFVTDGFYKIEDFDYNATTATYTLKAGVPSSQSISGALRPGVLKIKDINGDGAITTDGDRTIVGNANPKFTGGWNNQFGYKNFDLSVFVNFVVGNDVYNANKIEWTDGTFPNLNILGSMRNRWRNINDQGVLVTDPAELAKLNVNTTQYSPLSAQRYFLRSDAVEDGSFLRFNNISLGYTLPSSLTKRIKLSQLRVYATVNNLAVITNYSGFDPEVTARRSDPLTPGVDFGAYPRSKAWVFGLNVTF
ncbi:MAG TPA: TonB-dependent receptor [Chitinophagaceae bacterium]|nr:TonB-dependent receptor [Chitinophagaceae bacterium]